jgi:drug/metabolite transporter (DMT)-like permease
VRFAVVLIAVFPWLLPMPRPRWRMLVVGILMGAGTFALVFIGLQTASPSAVAIVSQVGVPITTLLSFLILRERLTGRRVVGMLLTLTGVLAVMWDPHGFKISTGLLFIVAASFLGGLGAVMMKQMEGVKPLRLQAWVGLSSLAPMAALTILLEPGQVQAGIDAGWPFVAAALFSGLVVSVVAHTLYYSLIQKYEANLISPLTLMTPLATIAMGVVFTNDVFDLRMAFGTAVALAGVLVIALRPSQAMALLVALRNRSQ